ncbi:GTP-binding protein [Bizionia gelidisalsuginis]|uniref:GTP-binding protein n=2 Tax=Bizionia TaxID=283785 RepID=A0A8H2QKV6_9FLAO|nr:MULTISPECIES: GTP-binding protein [Bizionia]TYB72541.1 GTP-binding protein [Bizionia saleffrena]TYC09161.1 GTP-binding protein [Bizionia gelidisalsuginis]
MNKNINDVVLRPRFKRQLNTSKSLILDAFETIGSQKTEFIVSRIEDHVFIKLPKAKQQFWSPQLHLEINEVDEKNSRLYGLFGPNPTVWTLFMFLHFAVAGLFIAFAIWAYSNASLNTDYQLQIWGMSFMVIVWFVLYFAARVSKSSNQAEMNALYRFMKDVLQTKV